MLRVLSTALLFTTFSVGLPSAVQAQIRFQFGGGRSGGNYNNNRQGNNGGGLRINTGGLQWRIGPNGVESSNNSAQWNNRLPSPPQNRHPEPPPGRHPNPQPSPRPTPQPEWNWHWIWPPNNFRPPINPPRGNPQWNNQPTIPVPQQNVEVPENTLPENNEPVTDPRVNPIDLSGRQMPTDEIERAKKFFQDRLMTLVSRLEQRTPNIEFNESDLIDLLTRNDVPAETQVQLLDLLNAGDLAAAEELWRRLLPELEKPFGRGPLWDLFEKIRIALLHRRPICDILQPVITSVPPMIAARNCCSADDLLTQLEQESKIYDALVVESAQPIASGGGQQSTPIARQSVTQLSQQSTATLTAIGPSARQVGVPTGEMSVVQHPKLPIGDHVVVNPKLMFQGTGGLGSFHVQTGHAAEILGYQVEAKPAVPAYDAELVRDGIVLLNEVGGKVNFVVDNRQLSLASGYQQTIRSDDTVLVSFDTGAGTTQQYTLSPGTFRFKPRDGALDLVQAKFRVTIDNRKNRTPFVYIVQGEHAVAAPGQSTTHKSDFPLIIRFDRGNGQTIKQVRHGKKDGRLVVAVNTRDHLWDLFDAGASASGTEPSTASPIQGGAADYVPAF